MMLLPDRLRELWKELDAKRMSAEECTMQQERWLDDYRRRWGEAMLGNSHDDLRTRLFREVGAYYQITDLAEVERRCASALATLRHEWHESDETDPRAKIENFYESPTTIYELIEWHTLQDDTGPLAYVLGLDIARERQVRTCLDFGSGIGSGALLFARAGISMTLADISTTLLDFARWRFTRRGLPVQGLDLKHATLPDSSFDMILAMDVFEHLAEPVQVVEQLWRALRPGGLLFARIHAEEDAERPQHIVRDFEPTFARIRELGLVETWRDTWLWGHQLLEKRAG
jgi:2-polyprenyl-3-methyl-5-hydroxy-6-metoxy-1,4-benzoquinol methylase